MLETQYIDKKFDSVYTKLDEVKKELVEFKLHTTKRVDRNTLILNGILYVVGIVVTANVVCLVRYFW